MISEQHQPQHLSVSVSLHLWLFGSSCFSGLLLLIRIISTNSPHYLFLPWNLFLAFIPYGITWMMTRRVDWIGNRFKFIAALTVWLLFIPNSFYIITDLFHLSSPIEAASKAPRWFDLLLIFSFAWNGMVAGIVSLRRIEIILGAMSQRNYSSLLIFSVMWLSAFGIYIGRFLRFNSWDVLTNPFSLAVEIWDMVVHPFENSYAWGMTLSYSLFMTLFYFTIRKLSEFFMAVK